MPGALTMVIKRQADLPEYMTNGWETIGVRMPDDAFVLALIAGCGAPMLVSSANRSGEATGTTFEEVMRQLDGRIDGIVKGTCGCMSASTIIDLSQDEVKVLREGPITKAQIEEALARRAPFASRPPQLVFQQRPAGKAQKICQQPADRNGPPDAGDADAGKRRKGISEEDAAA